MTAQTKEVTGEIIEEKFDGLVVTEKGLDYSNFAGLWKLSKLLVASGMVPRGMEGSPEKVCIAVARGRSLGLDTFQSMESFCVINGKAKLYGNAPLALCRQSPNWDEGGFSEYFEQKGERIEGHPQNWNDDSITAVCTTRRKGGELRETRFSVADAKRAGLWGQNGKLYGTYPQRMMMFRARGYALEDNFGDSLKGIPIRETFDDEEIPQNEEERKLKIEKLANPLQELNQKIREANPHIVKPVVLETPAQNGGGVKFEETKTEDHPVIQHAPNVERSVVQPMVHQETQKTETIKKDAETKKVQKQAARLRMDIQGQLYLLTHNEDERDELLQSVSKNTKCGMGETSLSFKDLATCENIPWMKEIEEELSQMEKE